jgi:hypothetical protein
MEARIAKIRCRDPLDLAGVPLSAGHIEQAFLFCEKKTQKKLC